MCELGLLFRDKFIMGVKMKATSGLKLKDGASFCYCAYVLRIHTCASQDIRVS